MYELYEKLIKATESKDPGDLTAASMNWISKAEENPFEETSPAFELFFKAKMAWMKWLNNGIDARRNRVRAKEYTAQIAMMHLPNPYKKEEAVVEPVVETKPDEVVAQTVQVEEPIHVLGVVPEEKTAEPEIAPVTEKKIEQKQPAETKHEVVREIKNPDPSHKKGQFFGKKKK